MRKLLALAVLTILLVSAMAVGLSTGLSDSGSPETRESSRKTQEQITTFTDGRASADLEFSDGGGTNTELNITFPKRSTVLSASVDMEGIMSASDKQFDYNDTANNSAWNGAYALLPTNEKPSTFEQTAFTNTEYPNVQNIDTLRVYSSNPGVTKNNTRLFQLFKFKVNIATPSKFNFYWIGRSYMSNGIMQYTDELSAYIYCPQNTTWVKFHYLLNTGIFTPSNLYLNKDIQSASNYKNSTDSSVYFLLIGGSFSPLMLGSRSVETDYVKLMGFAGAGQYPSNVGLDVGGDGDSEWSVVGDFKTKVTIGDTQGFKAELQEHIDAAGTDVGDMVVVLKLSAGTKGNLQIDNLNIQIEALELNEPPRELAGQLGHFYMTEDDSASGDSLVDLTTAFDDDHDSSTTLKYAVAGGGSPETLEAVLDADGYHVDFVPAQDFYGTVMFRVSAADSGADEEYGTFDDLVTVSRYFNVTVQPENDAPELTVPGEPLVVDELETLTFEVTVADVDDDTFTWETNLSAKVTITQNSTNSSKADIEVQPDTTDTGKQIHFRLRVLDNGGGQGEIFAGYDAVNITVNVVNLNDPPKLVELTIEPDYYTESVLGRERVEFKNDDSAYEDEYYNLTVTAEDPDLGIEPSEKLTYTIAPVGTIDGTLDIDSQTGLVSLLPTNADVGTVEFDVTVTDWKGESDSVTISVQVKNTNDAPFDARIILPVERVFKVTDKITFKGECFDDDLNVLDSQEFLSFSWYSNRSEVTLGMGDTITEVTLPEGWNEVTLEVRDVDGETAFASIEVQVLPLDTDPDDITDPDKDKDSDGKDKDTSGLDDELKGDGAGSDEKQGSSVYLAVLAIIIIIVIIVLVVFGVLKPRLKKKEEDEKAELTSQPPGMLEPVPIQPQLEMPGQFETAYQIPYGTAPVAQQLSQPAVIQPAAQVVTAPQEALPVQTEEPAYAQAPEAAAPEAVQGQQPELPKTKPLQ